MKLFLSLRNLSLPFVFILTWVLSTLIFPSQVLAQPAPAPGELDKPANPSTTITESHSCGVTTISRDPNILPPAGDEWRWQDVSGASLGSGLTIPVYSAGTYYLRAYNWAADQNWSDGRLTITVTSSEFKTIPNKPTGSATNNCGSSVLTRGTPPTDVTWYWQKNNSNGTSTSNSSSPLTITSGTDSYYLRAQHDNSKCWSDVVSVGYSIKEKPVKPSSSAIKKEYRAGSTVVSVVFPSDLDTSLEQWYWQSNTSNPNTNDSYTNTKALESNGTLFLMSKHKLSDCWSEPLTINVSVYNKPDMPSAPSKIEEDCDGFTVLTMASNNTSYQWYWQDSADGESTNGRSSGSTITLYELDNISNGGVHYIRAYNSNLGFWSNARAIPYVIYKRPNAPSVVVSDQCGYSRLTRASSTSSNIRYYWQNTENGTSEDDNAEYKIMKSGSEYYIRALDTDIDCWSFTNTVDYDIKAVPSVPDETITVSNKCGSADLSIPVNGDDVSTWYWQSTSGGTTANEDNDDISIELTEGSIYFLRAQHDDSGCWSEGVISADYAIKLVPSVPTASAVGACGEAVLTRDIPPSDATWYWHDQGEVLHDELETSESIIKKDGNRYYISAQHDGSKCWSDAELVSYTIKEKPNDPTRADLTIEYRPGSTVVSATMPDDFETGLDSWYWQTDPDNPKAGDSYINTKTLSSDGTLYLMSKNTSECWSEPLVINETVHYNPEVPLAPSEIDERCDGTTVMIMAENETEDEWYWESVDGDLFNPTISTTIELTETNEILSGGKIYLKAYNPTLGFWSNALEVPYVVYDRVTAPIPVDVTLCTGERETITVSSGTDAYLNWYSEDNYDSFISEGDNYTTSFDTDQTLYMAKVAIESGCKSPIASLDVTVIENSEAGVVTGETTAFEESSGVLRVDGTVGAIDWQEEISPNNWSDLGEQGSNLSYRVNESTNYRVKAVNEFCPEDISDPVTVKVLAIPVIGFSGDPIINIGDTKKLTVEGIYDTYQWYKNDSDISGADQASYDVTKSGSYQVSVTQNGLSANSSAVEISLPVDYQNRNYVKSYRTKISGKASLGDLDQSISDDYGLSVMYYDGLGRSIQSQAVGQSTTRGNIIQPVMYDDLGRQAINYLPYVSEDVTSGGAYDENYYTDLSTATDDYTTGNQYAFYQEGVNTVHDTQPFSVAVYEPSPLNRVIKQYAPGQVWSQSGQDKPVTFGFENNKLGEVQYWHWSNEGLVLTDTYESGTLYKMVTIDENGNQVQEFKDFQGQVVLKRVQVSEAVPANDADWADTYYVYDDFGNLRYVLPPEAIKKINSKEVLYSSISFIQPSDAGKATGSSHFPMEDAFDGVLTWDETGDLESTSNGSQSPYYNSRYGYIDFGEDYDKLHITETWTLYRSWSEGDHIGYETMWWDDDNDIINDNGVEEMSIAFNSAQGLSKIGETQWAKDFVATAPIVPANRYLICKSDPDMTRRALEYAIVGYSEASRIETITNELTFQYRYDSRQRMSEKRVPGSGWVYMVYDDRDRLVLTQDANQREDNEWLFTKYDGLNRPVMTGVYTHTIEASQAEMQEEVNTFYENTDNEWSESRDNTEALGYTDNSFPLGVNTEDYFTVTYYDNYDFVGNADWTMSFDLTGSQSQAKTFVTGMMTKVLGEGDDSGWNQSVTLYDSRYRVQSVHAQDYQGNTDALESEYYSLVHPLVVETQHTHTHAASGVSTKLTETFDYDHADRLMSVTHQINDETPVVLVTNEYNELGELITKKLHADESTYKQEIDYAYNIRGWLTKINDPSTNDPTEKYFSMQLKYTSAATPQYNGNIGESDWTNPFEMGISNYAYGYDPMNRLTDANFSSGQAGRDYTVNNISYDLNGNILTLDRLGDKANGADSNLPGESIDELIYTYDGNQLLSVTDNSNSETGFNDGIVATKEYHYDANGNMTKDFNKGITEIQYNHLNLPEIVILSPVEESVNERSIKYIYDAAGTKHTKIVYEDGVPTKRTDYRGAFIYETAYEEGTTTGTESLQFIQHAEGRIVIASDSEAIPNYDYQYHLKDHLGNVRSSFTTNPKTDQSVATLETSKTSEETQYFENYDAVTRIKADLFNHTSPIESVDSEYAMRLNGTADETIGLVRQLKVKPGDVINLEVYAKYFYHTDNSSGTAIINTVAGNILDAAEYVATESAGVGLATFPFADFFTGTNAREDDENAPQAYLNYLVFDNNYNPIAGTGFQQISTSAAEDGSGVPHQRLSRTLDIVESGYVYIYLSNEEETPIDVFFDDFKVEQQHTPIVQKDDYYPYGLTFNSYTSGTENLYKYNGFEEQKETGWYDYQARQYDPALGRFTTVDPAAGVMRRYSPYSYAFDNPIRFIDPDGMMPSIGGKDKKDIKPYFEDRNTSASQSTQFMNIERSGNDIDVQTFNGLGESNGATSIKLAGVKQEHVTDKSAEVISDNATASGEGSVKVTSAYRDPKDQARVMHGNLESKGVAAQKKLYGASGDKVIDTYVSELEGGSCDICTNKAMVDKIIEIGPGKVSKHSSDPNTYNVVDIAPSSLTNQKEFVNSVKGDTRIKRVITPNNSDPAVHIEIPQK